MIAAVAVEVHIEVQYMYSSSTVFQQDWHYKAITMDFSPADSLVIVFYFHIRLVVVHGLVAAVITAKS